MDSKSGEVCELKVPRGPMNCWRGSEKASQLYDHSVMHEEGMQRIIIRLRG